VRKPGGGPSGRWCPGRRNLRPRCRSPRSGTCCRPRPTMPQAPCLRCRLMRSDRAWAAGPQDPGPHPNAVGLGLLGVLGALAGHSPVLIAASGDPATAAHRHTERSAPDPSSRPPGGGHRRRHRWAAGSARPEPSKGPHSSGEGTRSRVDTVISSVSRPCSSFPLQREPGLGVGDPIRPSSA
jgi:hypothetical protein